MHYYSVCYNSYMLQISVGLLMYRWRDSVLEVFLVHPGGPFWAKKDLGSWSIPKGLIERGEDLVDAARREFHEETGFSAPGRLIPLAPVKVQSGKMIQAWAVEGDCDPEKARSNTFSMEWPPRSGRKQEFPEVDRAAWFGISDAQEKINKGQIPLLEELGRILPNYTPQKNLI
jgi:predicted NUDIX family NTP pyrophosphohydrolase